MIASRTGLPCLALLLWAACGDGDMNTPDTPVSESKMDEGAAIAALRVRAARSFEPLKAAAIPEDASERRRFDLGRALFFERRVSADDQVSCNTCHLREFGGADGLATALGVSGRKHPRNAPTVFNAMLQSSQHWHADRTSLIDQASRSPLGMNSFGNQDEAEALARLRDAGYQAAFDAAFPDSTPTLSLASFGAAIASFEQTLSTPGRFDTFLKGDNDALDNQELAGLELFMDTGCADCHSGPALGGNELAKFGVLEPYEQETGSKTVDQGRFDATQQEADRFVFKVPMLRNVAETAPYFHDGNVIGLEQAVRVMLKVQLGKQLHDYEVKNIVAFLKALSGDVPDWYAAP